jgi:serine/threonine protein kinase
MAQNLTQVGKYRIERELGRGAMGVVYKAFDPVVERMVAIKTIRLDVEEGEELVHRLRREAKSIGQLEHPNIVTLYDAGESGGLFYLAMQFIQGETLHDRINRQRWFTLKEVQELFRQMCAGLDYAHQRGVIHRDIKPANIMITTEGVVKLTDFGIAKLAGGGTTTHGLIVGTPSYMSPEQALGKNLDGRSDIFSLGSILYELITGEKAFPGQNTTTVIYKIVHEAPTPVQALQPGLDPAVEEIVLKALAKQPDQRFQSCNELSAALELYINRAIAGIPRTSVVHAPLAQPAVASAPLPAAAAGPSPPPTPVPMPVAPDSSGSVLPVAAPAPGTATQTVQARAGVPLAWLGGGVVGTLLLVIVILLVVQMRRPAPVTEPSSVPAASEPQTSAPSGSQTTAPAPSSEATTEPAGAKESPVATEPEATPASPQRSTLTPAATPQKPPARQTQRAAAAREKEIAAPAKPVPKEAKTERSQPLPEKAAGSAAQVAAPPPAAAPLPETFSELVMTGDLAFQQGDYQKALAAYSKAYRLDPRSREVRRKIAVTLTLLGRPEEARKYQ